MLGSVSVQTTKNSNTYFSTVTIPLTTSYIVPVKDILPISTKPVKLINDYLNYNNYLVQINAQNRNAVFLTKEAYDELFTKEYKKQEKGENEIMLNPNIIIPTIDHFEVYNNVAMKVYFKDYKDKNDYVKVTVQKDKNGVPYDEFNMERGLYLAMTKKLFKDKLNNHGIEYYADQLKFLISANKEVKKAIRDYNEEQAKIAKIKKAEEEKKKGFKRRKAKKIAKKAEKREREREDTKQFVKECVAVIQKETNKKED